jgi:hypothetical protein
VLLSCCLYSDCKLYFLQKFVLGASRIYNKLQVFGSRLENLDTILLNCPTWAYFAVWLEENFRNVCQIFCLSEIILDTFLIYPNIVTLKVEVLHGNKEVVSHRILMPNFINTELLKTGLIVLYEITRRILLLW